MDKDRPGNSALRKARYSAANQIYLITTVTFQRNPIFSDWRVGRLVIWELHRQEKLKFVETLAWVVMPDHLHWLMNLCGNRSLSDIMKSVKGRSAKAINQHCHSGGRVWQPAFHDHTVRREEDIESLACYVIANPLRAGLVKRIGDYPLWNSKWLPQDL